MAQLTAALSTLSAEYVRTAPPEVFRVFPDFAAELADMLTSSTVEQLVDVTASLESEASSIAVDFALQAVRAAVDVHKSWSRMGAAGADAAAFVADFGTFATEEAPQTQLEAIMANPPLDVAAAFPDFERELHAMLERPVDELRTTVSQLELALANIIEGRLFSESREEGQVANAEAHALSFSIRAMVAAVHEAEALADVEGIHRVLHAKALRGAAITPTPPEDAEGMQAEPPHEAEPHHEVRRPMLPHELSELQFLLPGALDALKLEEMDEESDADETTSASGPEERDGTSSTAGTDGDVFAPGVTGGCRDATPEPFCFKHLPADARVASPKKGCFAPRPLRPSGAHMPALAW